MSTKSLSAFLLILETKFSCLSRPGPRFVLGIFIFSSFSRLLHLKEKLHHPSAPSVSPHYRIFFKRALISPLLGKPLFTETTFPFSYRPLSNLFAANRLERVWDAALSWFSWNFTSCPSSVSFASLNYSPGSLEVALSWSPSVSCH